MTMPMHDRKLPCTKR